MCVCVFANCALAVLMFNKNRDKQTQNITVPSPMHPLPNRIRSTVQGWTIATRRSHCNNPGGGPLQLGGTSATVQRVDRCNSEGPLQQSGGGPLQIGRAIATVQGVDRCNSEGSSQQSSSPAGGPLPLGGAIATVQGVDRCNSEEALQQSSGWTVATRRDHRTSPGSGLELELLQSIPTPTQQQMQFIIITHYCMCTCRPCKHAYALMARYPFVERISIEAPRKHYATPPIRRQAISPHSHHGSWCTGRVSCCYRAQ